MTHGHAQMAPEMVRRHYWMLALNLVLSTAIMYLVMFTMIWRIEDFFNNLNMFYMALMMVSPMAILMLLMMGMMYPRRKLNLLLYAGFALLFVLGLAGVRQQWLIGDEQFLRSMIPHHSGAILMCERAQISNPQIGHLCEQIVRSQQAEIAQMKAMLARR